jgi:hypothetical protein
MSANSSRNFSNHPTLTFYSEWNRYAVFIIKLGTSNNFKTAVSSWRGQAILPLLLNMIFLDCIQKQDHIPFKSANSPTFTLSAFQESSPYISWLHSIKQRSNRMFSSTCIRRDEQTCRVALWSLPSRYISQQTNLVRRLKRMAGYGYKWCSALQRFHEFGCLVTKYALY